MPIVLTQNESNSLPQFDYKDIEGVQYEYPNIYKNRIAAGERFVYYRGSLDADGQRRIPEYFGHGVIASTEIQNFPDSKPSERLWMATIDAYQAFAQPVPFKTPGGYLEPGGNRRGYFQQGVRTISDSTFDLIVGTPHQSRAVGHPLNDSVPKLLLPSDFSSITDTLSNAPPPSSKAGSGTQHRASHHNAKWVGELAEQTVYEFLLLQSWASEVRWLEAEGYRPGWDIQYRDEHGELVYVEVKGTTLNRFRSCDITAHEWDAARDNRSRYQLYLLTNVGRGHVPRISRIFDPYALFDADPSVIQPTGFTLFLMA